MCIVLADDTCEESKIRMNKVVRKNLKASPRPAPAPFLLSGTAALAHAQASWPSRVLTILELGRCALAMWCR